MPKDVLTAIIWLIYLLVAQAQAYILDLPPKLRMHSIEWEPILIARKLLYIVPLISVTDLVYDIMGVEESRHRLDRRGQHSRINHKLYLRFELPI